MMTFILSQVAKTKIPQWNERVFTLEDFEILAESTDVKVLEIENKFKGEYLIFDNHAIIILRKGLKLPEKTWIAWHELAHHLLHYPVPHRFSKSTWRRMDREANFIAAIALIPTSLVKSKSLNEIVDEYNYPIELIKIRKEIFEEYRI